MSCSYQSETFELEDKAGNSATVWGSGHYYQEDDTHDTPGSAWWEDVQWEVQESDPEFDSGWIDKHVITDKLEENL